MRRRVFVDTSALYAVMDADDEHHETAAALWRQLLSRREVSLITSNYVLVETSALIQRRLGIAALGCFQGDVVPALRIRWVTRRIHKAAMESAIASGKRLLSVVDCSSFEIMRRAGISEYFAFDEHFDEMGFTHVKP